MPFLPTLNALLNAVAAVLLVAGRARIKRGDQAGHKRIMLTALTTSALFLISYSAYHLQVGSVPYPRHDWTRPVYLLILAPHVVLAALQVPFVIALVWLALRGRFEQHRRLARYVWPVWMFVSVSGVAVYLMLYVLN
jgi:putative membrane protein